MSENQSIKVILVDIGNTTVEFAFYYNGSIQHKFYILLDTLKNNSLESIISEINLPISLQDIQDFEAIASSVAPSCNDLVEELVNQWNLKSFSFINHSILKDFFNIEKDISHIGIDLLCKNAWNKQYNKKESIILDIGTATVLQHIDNQGLLKGVTIAPGVNMMFSSLNLYTELLPLVSLKKENKILNALNTEECIQKGVFWGYLGLIKETLNKSSSETSCNNIYITGGNSVVFKEYLKEDYTVNSEIIFYGILAIYNHIKNIK